MKVKVGKNIYDSIKGIGIMLVVLGHIWIAPEFLQKIIYAFHMPMFFILSGYLFNQEEKIHLKLSEFVVPRVKRLYFPALFIGVTCAVPSVVSGQIDSITEFAVKSFGILYSIPKAELTFNCTPIWFLTCLLCVEIYYYLLIKFVQRNLWIAVGCAFSVGVVLSREVSFFSPLNSHIALSGLFFFYIGTILRTCHFIDNHRPKIIYACLAVFALLISTYLNPIKVGMASNRLGDLNYLIIGVISGSYLVFCLARLLKNIKIISFLGRNTILILGYNYWAYLLVDQFFRYFSLPYNWAVNFFVQILLFILASLVLTKSPMLDRLVKGNMKPKIYMAAEVNIK